MTTEFGKFLRKLRVDRELTLADMAKHLSISASQLSAIELGKRNVNQILAEKIAYVYNESDVDEVKRLIHISNSEIKIKLDSCSYLQKDIAIEFANNIDNLSRAQIYAIQHAIRKKSGYLKK